VVHPLFVRLPINIFQQTIIHLSRLSAALNVTCFPPYYTLVTLPTDYSTPLAAICSPYSHLIPAILYPWTNSKLGGPRTQLLEMVLSNYSWRDFHRIHHQLDIYGMNSVDVFVTITIHRKHYKSCVTHLCKSETISHKPLPNDWLVLCVGDAKLA
jgi:hypothetical protein